MNIQKLKNIKLKINPCKIRSLNLITNIHTIHGHIKRGTEYFTPQQHPNCTHKLAVLLGHKTFSFGIFVNKCMSLPIPFSTSQEAEKLTSI